MRGFEFLKFHASKQRYCILKRAKNRWNLFPGGEVAKSARVKKDLQQYGIALRYDDCKGTVLE
jgi:hypothetical protein